MNESLQQWIDARMTRPGTLGGGMRGSDGASICQSADEAFSREKVQRLLEQLAQFQPKLFEGLASPRWSTWRFEQGKIRCVVRPDGWLLGLVVRLESEADQQLDKTSDAFLTLDMNAPMAQPDPPQANDTNPQ
jgi:hypothetical protein